MQDVRDTLFRGCGERRRSAAITAERAGLLAGSGEARRRAEELGLEVAYYLEPGSAVERGETVMLLRGAPKQIALAEESLMGLMSKASGIATAARSAVAAADGRLEIVAGAWKKMPPELKQLVRGAVTLGGARCRIAEPPFLYLDKNYVKLLGGVPQALAAAEQLGEMTRVIQLKSPSGEIAAQAEQAVRLGADIVMVDTGEEEDVRAVSRRLRECGLRERVKLAFAKGIQIADIPALAREDIDFLDIGAAIVDAPLLDMRLDVVEEGSAPGGEANLFQKTELWLDGVVLDHADLNELAACVAGVLSLDRREVLVIDVQPDYLTLDLLRRTVRLEQIAGRERELLERLAGLPGVRLKPDACVHSEGILGVIAMPPEESAQRLACSRLQTEQLQAGIARRVRIFPTGTELIRGSVKDTNSPLIQQVFEDRGYTARVGDAVEDSVNATAARLMEAVGEGYGVVITTGGTGAEGKDCAVEAVQLADPTAATPWIMKFQKGAGRHLKEGVRVAVGRVEEAWLIALPGPNDEVRTALEVLPALLEGGWDKACVADALAARLRAVVQEKSGLHHHHS